MKKLSLVLYVLLFALLFALLVCTDLVGFLLRGDIQGLRAEISSYGWLAPAVSVTLMALQAIISPIPAVILYIVNGLLFGIVAGFLISWGGALLSGGLCFWLVRKLSLDVVVKGRVMDKTNIFMNRYGSRGVFFARIAPFMPTDLVSYAFGLTNIGAREFFIGTALGQTPAIAVYTWFGAGSLDWYWYAVTIIVWSGLAWGLMKLADTHFLPPGVGAGSGPGHETL